jgi:hypothetical protein
MGNPVILVRPCPTSIPLSDNKSSVSESLTFQPLAGLKLNDEFSSTAMYGGGTKPVNPEPCWSSVITTSLGLNERVLSVYSSQTSFDAIPVSNACFSFREHSPSNDYNAELSPYCEHNIYLLWE